MFTYSLIYLQQSEQHTVTRLRAAILTSFG